MNLDTPAGTKYLGGVYFVRAMISLLYTGVKATRQQRSLQLAKFYSYFIRFSWYRALRPSSRDLSSQINRHVAPGI